jgi:hypothetical protein
MRHLETDDAPFGNRHFQHCQSVIIDHPAIFPDRNSLRCAGGHLIISQTPRP